MVKFIEAPEGVSYDDGNGVQVTTGPVNVTREVRKSWHPGTAAEGWNPGTAAHAAVEAVHEQPQPEIWYENDGYQIQHALLIESFENQLNRDHPGTTIEGVHFPASMILRNLDTHTYDEAWLRFLTRFGWEKIEI